MATLTKDDILKASVSTEVVPLDVPELGGTVYVRGISSGERDGYEQSVMQLRGDKLVPKLSNARAKLIVLALSDEEGARLFSDADVTKLGEMPAKASQRIFDKARELAGLSEEDVSELEGNSGADQSA